LKDKTKKNDAGKTEVGNRITTRILPNMMIIIPDKDLAESLPKIYSSSDVLPA